MTRTFQPGDTYRRDEGRSSGSAPRQVPAEPKAQPGTTPAAGSLQALLDDVRRITDPLEQAEAAGRLIRELYAAFTDLSALRRERVAELMASGKWTVAALARELGVSRQMIVKIDRRRRILLDLLDGDKVEPPRQSWATL